MGMRGETNKYQAAAKCQNCGALLTKKENTFKGKKYCNICLSEDGIVEVSRKLSAFLKVRRTEGVKIYKAKDMEAGVLDIALAVARERRMTVGEILSGNN